MHATPSLKNNGHRLVEGITRLATVGLLALTVSACSVIKANLPFGASSNNDDYALISASLLDAVSQYPELDSSVATLQVASPENDFERQVIKELKNRGYQIESTSSSDVANSVKASVREIDDSVGQAYPLYSLAIGKVSAERQFSRIDGKPVPASELVIRGAQEQAIELSDTELFGLPPESALSTVAFKDVKQVKVKSMALHDLLNPAPSSALSDPLNRSAQSPVRANIYDARESNYSSVFVEYEDIESEILVFPNDSLQLGEVNKVIIERFVDQMNTETDILSVIGCSHGQTNISNGNSVLALGRANRVKEALMFSGVEHDKVLEEGCWAPVEFDEVMPRRGVVLTLKRSKNT